MNLMSLLGLLVLNYPLVDNLSTIATIKVGHRYYSIGWTEMVGGKPEHYAIKITV